MKIHGTTKGGALSHKDFGVAFGGAPPVSEEIYNFTAGTTVGTTNENIRGIGNKFQTGQDVIGQTVTKMSMWLKNLSGGTLTMGVYDATSLTRVFTFGTVTTTTSDFVEYTKENLDGHVLEVDQIIGFDVSGVYTVSHQRYNTGVGADPNVEAAYWATSSGPEWQVAGDHQDNNMILWGYA